MKSRNGVLAIGVIGIIVICFSMAVFFLLDFERVTVHWWALVFLLLSEFALFSGLISLRYSKAVYSGFFQKTGISTSLTLYFVVTLVCTLLAGSFRENLNVYLLIHLAIIALFAVVIIMLSVFSSKLEQQGKEDIKKIGVNEPKRGGF